MIELLKSVTTPSNFWFVAIIILLAGAGVLNFVLHLLSDFWVFVTKLVHGYPTQTITNTYNNGTPEPSITDDQKKEKLSEISSMIALYRQNKLQGIQLIAAERQSQIVKHGYTPEKSVELSNWYENNELLQAAAFAMGQSNVWPSNWTTEARDKIVAKEEVDRYAVAGAFIAAHIDFITLMYKAKRNE